MANKKATREKISSTGFGESKPFVAPEGTFSENPVLNLHVGGVLVRDLPIEMQGRIVYAQTDEGFAENNEGKVEGAARVISDGFNKALEQRKDDVLERDMESYEARDPLKEVHDQYIQPGMRGKFLSPRKVKENGGTGDYEIVKDAKQNPVSVHGMVLGQMPERKARARNKHYQERSNRLLTEMTERYKAEGGATAVADQ
jgi:hypothetical protein